MRERQSNWSRVARQRSKTYRNGYSPLLYQVLAAGFVLMAIVILVVSPWSPLLLIVAALNLLPAILSWRMSRMGARLEQQGIIVYRMFRTIRIPWSSFRRFVILPRPRDLLAKTGFVELIDGSLVWIQGMAPWGLLFTKGDDWAVEVTINEMNRKARRLKDARKALSPSNEQGG
jgi:hypothetical protein